MDERTVETYEQGAAEYGERRRAYHPARAEEFAAALPAGGMRLDLGSGPGHYLPHLGRPVVAADAAVAMLVEARQRHPGTPAVACDLEALPFRRGGLTGVWASKSLQHIPAGRFPMALTALHRALRLGGILDVTLFDHVGSGGRSEAADPAGRGHDGTGIAANDPAGGVGEPGRHEVTGADDQFPGRLFAYWDPETLRDLLVGAGFTVNEMGADPPEDSGVRRVFARATRARTLPDTVGPGMRLLVCGLNPSIYAADAGVGFARPGNRFWPAALAAGLASADRDPDAALRDHGMGMTDLVKRATVAASELRPDEYVTGFARVERLVRWLRPGAICFVGLAGWRAAVDRHAVAGVQPREVAGVPVYVMPSTSGLNAHSRLADLTHHLAAAARLAG